MKNNEILRSYGTDYKEMTKRLLAHANAAAQIPAGAKIGIKPNLVTAAPASFGGTTHPEVVSGIIEYLFENGHREIVIAEGSWVGDKTSEAFRNCGYLTLAEEYGVPLLDTQKDTVLSVDAAGLSLKINQCVRDFDFLINVPVLKGHCQTRITCALKNMKGLIPNEEKRRYHRIGLHKPIAHLNTVIRQDLIIVDHICGDLDFEEGGNPVQRDCVMVARDPVLLDAYVCALLDYEVDDVPYVRLAEKLGVGSADLAQLELVTCEGEITDAQETILPDAHPGSMRPPKGAFRSAGAESADSLRLGVRIARTATEGGTHAFGSRIENSVSGKRVLDVSYAVDEVDSCSACYGSLVPALDQLKQEGLLEKLPLPIAIGQGHRGKSGKLGVGDCTAGFDICVRGCPPTTEEMLAELRAIIKEK